MKSLNYSSLMLLAVLFLSVLASCTRRAGQDPSGAVRATLTGTADSALNHQMIYIIDPFTGTVESSTAIEDCRFDFDGLPASGDSCVLRLLAAEYPVFDTTVLVTLPFVIENAPVRAHIGASLGVTGSPLNDRITDFLIELDEFAGKAHTLPAGDFREMFSLYLTGVISENHDNVLGRYLFRTYSDRLDPASLERLDSEYGFRP